MMNAPGLMMCAAFLSIKAAGLMINAQHFITGTLFLRMKALNLRMSVQN